MTWNRLKAYRPQAPYYAVLHIVSGCFVYQGRKEGPAFEAWNPGTVMGVSDSDQESADARARQLMYEHRRNGYTPLPKEQYGS